MKNRKVFIETALTGFNKDLALDYQIALRLESSALANDDSVLLSRAQQRLQELHEIDLKRAKVARSWSGRVALDY